MRAPRFDPDDLLARIAVLEATVADLVAQQRRQSETASHFAERETVLEGITERTHALPFTGKQFFVHLRVTSDEAMIATLAQAGIRTPKELGWWMRRMMRQIGEFSIHRFPRRRRDGHLWQVVPR